MKIKKGICVLVAFLLLNERGFSTQVLLNCYKCEKGDCNKTTEACTATEKLCLNSTFTATGGVKTGRGCVADCTLTTVQEKISGFTGTPVCCDTDLCNRDLPVGSSSSVGGPSVAALLGVALLSLLLF